MTDPFADPPEKVAHADLWRGMAYLNERVRQSEISNTTRDGMLEGLNRKIDALVERIGAEKEDDDGNMVATGLYGRVNRLQKRIDHRFRLYDSWKDKGLGMFMAASVLVMVIWWLTKGKIEQIFHGA